jgi:tryptophanyl-tRNA synthetase
MKTVFSGIQPSGDMHLGNYVGAIRNWVALQEQYRCVFCIVDYHAISQDYPVKEMSRRVFDMAVDILALGIDPERSTLFVQSMVPEHTELCWVLNAVTGFGDLERMTQFKDKAEHQPENINAALFEYPVLQAADILLYKADLVPVGADQVQHLELARRIARSFNHRWGKVFVECEPKLTAVAKLLGTDGKQKMSKSFGNHIPLSSLEDKPLRKLLAKAVTDEKRVERTDPGDPDVCNVFSWHKLFSTEEDLAWVREGCTTAGIGCVDCKGRLAERLLAHFAPYRARRAELIAHPEQVTAALHAGAEKARAVARRTMDEVRGKLGLWR